MAGRQVKKGAKKRTGRKHHLTDKQKTFVSEYLKDMNGSRAARVAGYAEPGQFGWRLLAGDHYPLVRQAVDAALEERRKALRINGDRITDELAHVGFFSPRSLLDDEGNPIALKDLPDEVFRAIKTMKVSYQEDPSGKAGTLKTVDMEFHNKLEALKQLAGMLGLGQSNVNITLINRLAVEINGMPDGEILSLATGRRLGTNPPANRLGYRSGEGADSAGRSGTDPDS